MREYKFDAEKQRMKWLRGFVSSSMRMDQAVMQYLEYRGGKDSSIAAALCVEALGRDSVIGVLMPNGEQADIEMAATS